MRDAQKASGDNSGNGDTFFVGTQVQFGNGEKVLFGRVTKCFEDGKYAVRFADGQVMKLKSKSLKRFNATSDNGAYTHADMHGTRHRHSRTNIVMFPLQCS